MSDIFWALSCCATNVCDPVIWHHCTLRPKSTGDIDPKQFTCCRRDDLYQRTYLHRVVLERATDNFHCPKITASEQSVGTHQSSTARCQKVASTSYFMQVWTPSCTHAWSYRKKQNWHTFLRLTSVRSAFHWQCVRLQWGTPRQNTRLHNWTLPVRDVGLLVRHGRVMPPRASLISRGVSWGKSRGSRDITSH